MYKRNGWIYIVITCLLEAVACPRSNEIPCIRKIRCISETIHVGRYLSPPTVRASSICSQQCEALCDGHSHPYGFLTSSAFPALFFSLRLSHRRSAAHSRKAISVHFPWLPVCWSHCVLLLVFPFPYVCLDDFFFLRPGCWHHRVFTPEIVVDRKQPDPTENPAARPPQCSTKS